MATKLGILWDEIDHKGKKPAPKDWRNRDLALYTFLAKREGLEIYHANYKQFQEGNLEKAWYYNGKRWVKKQDIDVEGIYDKFITNEDTLPIRQEIEDHVTLINSSGLLEVTADKWKTYQRFKDYSKPTKLAFEEKIREMLEDGKVVVKPRLGFGGEGIQIIDEFSDYEEVDEPSNYIVQEFIDTDGIEQLDIDQRHDLRLLVVNGEICSCYLRVPDEGLLSNVHQGGETIYIDRDDIPEEALKIARGIDKQMEEFSTRVYSIDLMQDKEGDFWLVELNDKPAVYCFKQASDMNREFSSLEKMFKAFSQAF